MKKENNLIEDFFFLFKGIGILTLVIIIGIGISKLGIDSLTNQKGAITLGNFQLLEDGSYQLTFLGGIVKTPKAIQLGQIENNDGQVSLKIGSKQLRFNTTLQMVRLEVLCKIIEKNFSLCRLKAVKVLGELKSCWRPYLQHWLF